LLADEPIKEIQKGDAPYSLVCDVSENTRIVFKDVGSGAYLFDLYVYRWHDNQWMLDYMEPDIYHHSGEENARLKFYRYEDGKLHMFNIWREPILTVKIRENALESL